MNKEQEFKKLAFDIIRSQRVCATLQFYLLLGYLIEAWWENIEDLPELQGKSIIWGEIWDKAKEALLSELQQRGVRING